MISFPLSVSPLQEVRVVYTDKEIEKATVSHRSPFLLDCRALLRVILVINTIQEPWSSISWSQLCRGSLTCMFLFGLAFHPLTFSANGTVHLKRCLSSRNAVSFQQWVAGSTFHRSCAGSLTHIDKLMQLLNSLSLTHRHAFTLTRLHSKYTISKTYTPSSKCTFPLSQMCLLRGKDKLLCGFWGTCLSHRKGTVKKRKKRKEKKRKTLKKGGFYLGIPFSSGNGQLVSMTPYLDSPLFLRQKSWKWWMTTSS